MWTKVIIEVLILIYTVLAAYWIDVWLEDWAHKAEMTNKDKRDRVCGTILLASMWPILFMIVLINEGISKIKERRWG